jgi:hypothetical protein
MPSIDAADVPTDLDLTCPRCQAQVTARFYGPCEACRSELRVAFAGEARDVEVEEYVPKMNVTPNAVASRE